MPLIDTHAHLDDDRFAGDRDAVLRRAVQDGVEQIVVVATSAASSEICLALAAQYPELWPTVGIHPNHVAKEPATAWDDIVRLSQNKNVVALGETGLDRHWNDTPFSQQEDFFARHLALSRQTGLPVVIHCREAEADVVAMLRADYERHGPVNAVMHSFVGAAKFAQTCLAMGLTLSFAGMLTYKNAQDLREAARGLPLDRLMVETDSPYLAPVPVRGKRNEPANVVHTARCLAEILDVPFEVLAEQTTRNARRLFHKEKTT